MSDEAAPEAAPDEPAVDDLEAAEAKADDVEPADIEMADVATDDAEPATASPELQRAERAFAVGDFRIVRELLPALAEDDDPQVRAAADTLARRVAVDPLHVGVLTLSAVLLAVLVYSYFY